MYMMYKQRTKAEALVGKYADLIVKQCDLQYLGAFCTFSKLHLPSFSYSFSATKSLIIKFTIT